MTTRCQRALRIGLLLSGAAFVPACGATGLDWVDEPQLPPRHTESASIDSRVAPSEAGAIPAAAEQGPEPEARPRLSHTVTLGEMAVSTSAAPAAAAAQGVSVTINNYTTVGPPGAAYGYGYGYAGFGYARSMPHFGNGGAASASRASASGIHAGQSWPAIVEHGSSFPLRAAPAPQWSRGQ